MYYIILFINLYLCLPCDSSIIPSGPKEELIIGGKSASKGQFPYAVALHYNGRFICTGTILSNGTVLTAGHCIVFGRRGPDPKLYYGVANTDRDAGYYRMNFSKIIRHPEYNYNTINHDIAIMKPTSPIPLTGDIKSIRVASSDSNAKDGASAIVVGWGRMNNSNQKIPQNLQYAPQKIVSNNKCGRKSVENDKNKMCAEGQSSGVCNGDSGGPLVSGDNKVQMGITSYGNAECASAPAVFTRLSQYNDFLKKYSEDDYISYV